MKTEHRRSVPRGKATWIWVEKLYQMVIHARSDPFEFGRHYSTTMRGFETISNCSEWRMARGNEFSCSVAGSTCCGYVADVGSLSSARHGFSQMGLERPAEGNTAPLSDSCSPMHGTGLPSTSIRGISASHMNLRYRSVQCIPSST